MTEKTGASRHLENFAQAHILCLGDVMLDRFVHGSVARVSQEAPIPILRGQSEQAMLGGAGNVARNVVSLGAKVTFISIIGDDAAAAEIKQLTRAVANLDCHFVSAPDRATTTKIRYIAAGQQLLRVDAEVTNPIDEALAEGILSHYEAALSEADVVVLSDYAKGIFSDTLLQRAIALARQAGKPIIADPKRSDFADYNGITVLKPNRSELTAAAGEAGDDDQAIERAGGKILAACEIDALLVSRSERGMSLLRPGAAALHLGAQARQVFDVSGAGDSVVAAMAVAIAAGAELAEAAEIANTAGAIVVRKAGTAVVTPGELAAALLQSDVHSPEAKIMDRQAALERVNRWRAAGMKVGFTNGCFDILHPGHIALLQDAAAECERLIVAINDDASVKRLKGPDRPLQSQQARAMILAALGAVDLVTIFDEDTPVPLLQLLQPDLLIKGGDYDLDGVVGADLVTAYGGEVRLSRQVPDVSTSNLIAAMPADGDGD